MCYSSALVPHLIIGLAVGAGFYGMFMLACGFFVKASNIVRVTAHHTCGSFFELLSSPFSLRPRQPGWWIWLHYISFHKYAFEVRTRAVCGVCCVRACCVCAVFGH